MSDFLDCIAEGHAYFDEEDPAVLEIHGVTPVGGCTATAWPLDGDVASSNGNQFRSVDSRVSVLRSKITGTPPEVGMPATLDGKSFTISAIKRDSVCWEIDLSDPRSL